jgi:adenylate kinase
MFVIVFGIQGSGKGTQGQLLSRRLGIPHLSTGELLRSIATERTIEGNRIRSIIESGKLLADDEMLAILERHLPASVILDGFPRTLVQAKLLDTIERVDWCVSIELTEEQAVRRALARGRADDTPEAIHLRIQQYHAQADAILDHYRAQGKLVMVDGDKSVDQVFADICRALRI